MRGAVPLALLAFGLVGCGDSKPLPFEPDAGQPDPSATFTRVQGEVFSPSCALAGCHAGSAPRVGLDLSPTASYGGLVGVPSVGRADLARIEPGDPEGSYLVKKLRGEGDIVGLAIPLDGTTA